MLAMCCRVVVCTMQVDTMVHVLSAIHDQFQSNVLQSLDSIFLIQSWQLYSVASLARGMEGDGHGSLATNCHVSVLDGVEKIMYRITDSRQVKLLYVLWNFLSVQWRI